MWEFLQDWFNQLEHQLRMQMDRMTTRVQANSTRAPRIPQQSAASMGDSLMGEATRPPDGFDRLWGKLNQLANLHSDEYKAAHPEMITSGNTPQHVIVDNADAIRPGAEDQNQAASTPRGSNDRINQLLERLKGMHSPEYKAAHPWQFRPPVQGSVFQPSQMSRMSQLLGGGRRLGQNRMVTMRRWARRMRRRFTMSPQTRSRVGRWMIHGGRAMQMGAGRLSAIGGPTAQYVASGMARAGMAMEGGGAALAGGVTASGAALAGGAVVGTIAVAGAFVVATKKMGEALIDSQRGLAQWNGTIALAIAQTDIHRMRLDSRQAAATSDNVAELNDAMRRLRESTQGLREGFANLGLKLATWGVEGANFLMESKEGISNGIADFFAWIMGTQLELEEERKGQKIAQAAIDRNGPGRQFMDALNNQPVAPRPPLRPIP
jgi:hypothetical protein